MKLEIKSLSKTYPNGIQALKKVSLSIPKGMFGLLGPNGAGKSTLMRTIATLQEADEGSIYLNGLDVLKDKMKVRQMLGYLPQDFGLYPEVTAEQMLNHIALLKGIADKKECRETVKYVLQQTNLYDARKRRLGGYSGGMRQRFGIAQALIGNPQLIIVDEPTAGLDPEGRRRFHNLLSEISENVIVILSTHIVDDVEQLCSQVAIINAGEILLTSKPEEAIKDLEGIVWEKIIEKEDYDNYRSQYQIVLTRLFAGNILIHVRSDRQPDGFSKVTPDLEDVYFTTIQNKSVATLNLDSSRNEIDADERHGG
jgi:ABC-type multidrug transport system ATPase subunit